MGSKALEPLLRHAVRVCSCVLCRVSVPGLPACLQKLRRLVCTIRLVRQQIASELGLWDVMR